MRQRQYKIQRSILRPAGVAGGIGVVLFVAMLILLPIQMAFIKNQDLGLQDLPAAVAGTHATSLKPPKTSYSIDEIANTLSTYLEITRDYVNRLDRTIKLYREVIDKSRTAPRAITSTDTVRQHVNKAAGKSVYTAVVHLINNELKNPQRFADQYVKKVTHDTLIRTIILGDQESTETTPRRIKVTSRYGVRRHPVTRRVRFHRGIDIRARIGTPIYAFADGVVSSSTRRGHYGNIVEISHGEYKTRYAHNLKNVVKPGQKVKRGQLIAFVGRTGRTTGSHVHFEILKANGKSTNPVVFISENLIFDLNS